MSFGSTDVLNNWAESEDFEFELWRDDNKTLALYYGAIETTSAFFPSRITVLLDADGNHIVSYAVDMFGIGDHPEDVLEDCEAIFGD